MRQCVSLRQCGCQLVCLGLIVNFDSVYVCVCVCVYVFVRVCACLCQRLSQCLYLCLCLCLCLYLYLCLSVCMLIFSICVCVCESRERYTCIEKKDITHALFSTHILKRKTHMLSSVCDKQRIEKISSVCACHTRTHTLKRSSHTHTHTEKLFRVCVRV